MILDLATISVTSCAATMVIGLVLCFGWLQERSSPMIGWWGVSQLVMAAGIAFAATASYSNSGALAAFGQALMVISSTIIWMAAREFAGRPLNPLWLGIWPCGFIIAAAAILKSFDQRLITVCTIMALLYVFTAIEFARQKSERLAGRWPAVLLLLVMAAGYIFWMPLALQMPILEVSRADASRWLPTAILIATLGRIALAFVVLAMVKERQEMRQRRFALTDALTGLPNRRALFEAADALLFGAGRHSRLSVMVLDLDHFKKINDTYGHRLGDRVLQRFSHTLAAQAGEGSIVARLGGEEFAAILPGAALETAHTKAERVRSTFADVAAVIDGLPIGGTVSIGIAAHEGPNCDISALFHRADGALYVAKQSGRNRVAAAEGGGEEDLDANWLEERGHYLPKAHATRRYRDSAA